MPSASAHSVGKQSTIRLLVFKLFLAKEYNRFPADRRLEPSVRLSLDQYWLYYSVEQRKVLALSGGRFGDHLISLLRQLN